MALGHRAWRTGALFVALSAGAWLLRDARGIATDLARPRTFSPAAYIGSAQCKRCHARHYASFRRTYHSTMTQEASARSVLGKFDGRKLEYMGVQARMQRGPAGQWRMTFTNGQTRWQADVVRTVGSHRYQQYLAREDDVYFRLPIAWDVARGRFLHMNGAFLTPDPVPAVPGAAISRADYDRHVTRWNDNCVFCHNVHANPGLDPDTGHFATRVAELGVACEACHGPGAEHARRNADPLRRYALHLGAGADPTITNPARLSAARSAQVCGRCHGQRIARDIAQVQAHGDAFVPGEALTKYSRPLARDTTLNGRHGVFSERFWRDGTPRLTAYEYQGYLLSACARGGALSCESCHAMHDGDPAGQIRPGRAGDAACTQCHTELATPARASAHSHHDVNGSGGRCVACHMPNLVYGLVSVHVSHRIEAPRPALQAQDARPDACSNCHVDRTRRWASAVVEGWRSERGTPRGAAHTVAVETGAEGELPQTPERLLAGDPIERAVAADALGRPEACYAPAYRGRIVGLLQEAIRHDPYPAVRSIAERALRAVQGDDPVAAIRVDVATSARLRARAAQAAIEIGE